VALVADSGALYALYDSRDKHHQAVRAAVESEPGPILVPVAILAEVEYLLRVRLGPAAEARFLEGIVRGAFTLCGFTADDAAACRELLARYRDLDLGLADASVIVAAERLGLGRILTVDARDFRAVRTRRGQTFALVP
jgi:predicted nucleic acid-binding protein